ncbi:MAG: cobalamin-binding protein [Firmicutes bacterium]|nr:cobalamin-binding protein [Bacillota bacterium]
MIDLKELTQAISDLNEEKAFQILQEFVAQHPSQEDVRKIIAACQQGMIFVGEMFDSDDYFVADLIFAGELMSRAVEILKPVIYRTNTKNIGTIVLGTVEGDMHDIGKNIFKCMAEAAGFAVHDLGVDVEPQKFVLKVKEVEPQIVAMSAVLTVAQRAMKNTVEALKKAGLRDKVKIIIGGNHITEYSCERIGADAFTTTASEGVSICEKWVLGASLHFAAPACLNKDGKSLQSL